MKNNIQPLSGFTLIELIIGMAIIAIISGALWGNFFSSLSKGRDSRRKQDLESVAKALEIYYNDKKAYPTALPAFGETFVNSDNSAVIYMPKL
ncbi:prepilin-type N-terminal cleavage/methylation domain-containing protein, partial [Candidatus Microgenomates bacterium]|nr:prepilin-type N-terminal cleavage/methylation domain-containing protein [Candidatus Microgenomates bacterium]